jgi:CubicO group peptidase (beta-lactamase class C family)
MTFGSTSPFLHMTLRYVSLVLFTLFLFSFNCFAQAPLVADEGTTSPLHSANMSKVTFMGRMIPLEKYTEKDFLTSYELKEKGNLQFRLFMATSLINYLHKIAPEMTPEQLLKNGNFRFTFFVDGRLIYAENINPGAVSPEHKRTKTTLNAPLISNINEASWGCFLWNKFMLRGGEEALKPGSHTLKIEVNSYVNTPELRTGELIASGQISVIVPVPASLPKQATGSAQSIAGNSGWRLSMAPYDTALIRTLNNKIADRTFKDITSIVVISNGKLLIEEYFNGAGRNTLHDTRSLGKTFLSAIMGIAIKDSLIQSEQQTLKDFYPMENYAYPSAEKENITLKELLTMTSPFYGSDQDAQSPGNEGNMYFSKNWVDFTLNLPLDSSKVMHARWDYFTPGVILLGDVLNRRVPGGLEQYADAKLFKPLGISPYTWEHTPQRAPNAAGSLRMRALDLAKFGQLYANKGKWDSAEVVTEAWVMASMKEQVSTTPTGSESYGYLFWNKSHKVNNAYFEVSCATGNGGNRIIIFKNRPIVMVITATAYNKPYAYSQIDKIVERYLLPAMVK